MADEPDRVTIVVADDEDASRERIARSLRQSGYFPVEVADGQEAIDRIGEGGIDLLITDLVMPRKEGIETIRELRRGYPDLPIIAISGAVEGSYLKAAAKLGASATLAKPFESGELLEAVRTALKQSADGVRDANGR